jgi:flagellar biosynthesis/type III secretory pathway protein FliH
MTNTPTPEAIVKAALERAAATLMCNCQGDCEWPEQCPQHDVEAILALASDQAEVAQIIQNAGGKTDPYLYAVGYDVGFEDGFKEAQAKMAKAVKALEKIAQHDIQALALNTLAELKGEK